jgi:acyl-CoA thioester hydrolase
MSVRRGAAQGGPSEDLARYAQWVPVEVRYGDLDTQGHVNNVVYFTYFEQARVSFLHDLYAHASRLDGASAAQPDGGPLAFVVADASCVYRRPIMVLAPVAVGVRVADLRRATLVLDYAVCDAPSGRLYAAGRTTLVRVAENGRPRALPAWLVAAASRDTDAAPWPATSGPDA